MKTKYRMWIIVQLADFDCQKAVAEIIDGTVQEMGGEMVKVGGLCDLVAMATFPHRKYKTVEKAVVAALCTLPVTHTIVTAQDPYIMRPKTLALTMELYRRQDEMVGLADPLQPE